MKTLKRLKSLPMGLITILMMAAAIYANYITNFYYLNLDNASDFFYYFSSKGNIGLTVVSIAIVLMSFSLYLSILNKVEDPFLIEQKIRSFFNKIRFFEASKKMHYGLTALRVIFFTIAMIFYIILTANHVGLGTGLSPTLEMVNPDFYLPMVRYGFIVYLIFEIGVTFFVKTKHSVSVLFLLNLFFIPVLASFIAGFTINQSNIMNISNISVSLFDWLKIISLAIFINVFYIILHKKYDNTGEKLSTCFDVLLPLSTIYLFYPIIFAFFTMNANIDLDPKQETTINGEVIQYKENVLTMNNTTMLEEDILEQSIGYPFKTNTLMTEALAFARNNNLDDEFVDALINTYIQQNEIYKENRTQILDTKLSDQYLTDFFKVKMLKIRVAVSDLEQETIFLKLLKDKKYQEAWDMYQLNLNDTQKENKADSNVIDSSIKGHRIGVEHSLENVFIHLHSKGLVNLHLEKFDKERQPSFNSSIKRYNRILEETKDVESYSDQFNLSVLTVDVIKNIINRHG